MLMKKTYVTPQLSVHEFIPNEFVAGCSPQEMVEGVTSLIHTISSTLITIEMASIIRM